ncbi:MAG: hypothetical protein COB46_04315 [Rhodospirillaceae bacterium]|nr:MAG: hypothetical protein COB46_04315 [Rhodospirillaceae bacterium]
MSPFTFRIHKPSPSEKKRLRACGMPFSRLKIFAAEEISGQSGFSIERSRVLKALSELQELRSVGPSLATKMIMLGCDSVASLENSNPSEMYHKLCDILGRRIDPCVEDVFRCAVAQSKYPNMDEQFGDWWHWTDQRGRADVPYPKEFQE